LPGSRPRVARDEPSRYRLVQFILVEELRLRAERDRDVEQLVLVVEAERRALVPPLDVDVPAAEAAVSFVNRKTE